MREIKFREVISYKIDDWYITTDIPKLRADSKGWYRENGYIMRKVNNHPKQNKRGYVAEHRLIYEKYLGRFLDSKEVIHHINGNREDNRLENLQLSIENSEHIKKYHNKDRNKNGQFICENPIFNEIKFRLFDKDRKVTLIFALNKLISTTFRRSKFEFRGRFTGPKDKNGKEIYEGDIFKIKYNKKDFMVWVEYSEKYAQFITRCEENILNDEPLGDLNEKHIEVIGNIYDNPELIKED